jgi:phage/plasmid-associated DNA primase
LEKIWPDVEARKWSWKAVSKSISGLNKEQVLFFCYGSGGNGKSLFFDAIKAAIDVQTADLGAGFLMDRTANADAATPALTSVVGKVLVTVQELADDNRPINEVTAKCVTGETRLPIRRLYMEASTLIVRFTLFSLCNRIPVIDRSSYAMMRRIRFLLFPSTFKPAGEPIDPAKNEYLLDTSLYEKLVKDDRARLVVFRCLVDGCREYLEAGLNDIPDALKPETVLDRAIDVAGFLRARYQQGEVFDFVQPRDLHQNFVDWAADGDGNVATMSVVAFGKEMSRLVKGRQFPWIKKEQGTGMYTGKVVYKCLKTKEGD